MSKQRIVKNMLIMGIGQVCTWGLSLLFLVLISRYLGPTRFGELTLAKSIIVVFWLGAKLGMDTLITRAVARDAGRAGPLTSAAMIVRTVLAIPVLLAAFAYAHLAHLNMETSITVYVYGAAEVVWSLQSVLLATFQGREYLSLNTIWTVGHNVLGLGLILIVMGWHGSVVAFAVTDVMVAVALLGLTMHWMRRFGRLTRRVSRRDLREVVTGGLAFWANDVFYTIYGYVDSVIVAALAGTRAVGIYAPAIQMFTAAMFLTSILGPATLPLLSRLGIDAGTDFLRAGRKALSLFIVCAVPLTIGVFTFAGPLIRTVFGPAYEASVPVLMVLSLCFFPMFLNFQFSQMLTASDRQWRWTAALAGACLVNPVLNFMLIPFAERIWHNPAEGAALAWLVTEILEVTYGVIILRDVVFDRAVSRVTLGSLGAGAIQGAILWAMAGVWPPMAEGIAAVAYAAVAIAVGALPRQDVWLLYETVARQVRVAKPQTAAVE